MIEVFKTNVKRKGAARILLKRLLEKFPGSRVNFDLEDCDKVLRIEGPAICPESTIELLRTYGHYCEVLNN
ncbi:hypothetical protein CKK33_05035 [Mucilaginibacter sp. MD40]|nr:hypothetical protein CKK33_05035 [Mucilaginibacter sp. MD40]